MFEILCAVIAVTIIGLTWHIWRPIAKWVAIIGGALALIGGAAIAVIHIKDEMRISALQKAKAENPGPWQKYKLTPVDHDPFINLPKPPEGFYLDVPVNSFTKAVAERNGFPLKAFRVKTADGILLSVTDVDEASAREYGEAWAKAHPKLFR